MASPLSAQERRMVILGAVGGASIGHDDSSQGAAPVAGVGAAVHLTPRLLLDGDVHTARVEHVFGRASHDFTEVTVTGSLLFRKAVRARVHVMAGGGLGVQRTHTEFELPPNGRADRVQSLRLVHGRIGAEWDPSSRLVIRTEAVFWFGSGLDWVLGGRVGLGYRF
jgi:hypothetical protein